MTNQEKPEDIVNTKLLRLAADAIEREPESYDQKSFGNHDGKPTCNTPCCVAAHMANVLNYDALPGEGMCDFVITHLVTRSGYPRNVGRRIFCAHWPRTWFDLAEARTNRMFEGTVPSPKDAVVILRYLADNPKCLYKS